MSSQAPSDRAVPVFVDRGANRRIMGATDWWFYPLLAVVAAGLIALSLGADAFEHGATSQRAARQGEALVYGPHEIARGARVDSAHVRFVVRDLGVNARAVRFAVRPHTPPPAPTDRGVQLLLDPADTAALVGHSVTVELQVRRFSITAAAAIALRLDDGPWVVTPLPATSGPVSVRLPAPAGPPRTLALRLISDRDDLNYGAEFGRIALRPGP